MKHDCFKKEADDAKGNKNPKGGRRDGGGGGGAPPMSNCPTPRRQARRKAKGSWERQRVFNVSAGLRRDEP